MTYKFEFIHKFDVIFKGEMTWREARLKGVELAKTLNKEIDLRIFDVFEFRWKVTDLRYRPDGLAIDKKTGKLYYLEESGRNFWEYTENQ